MQTHNTLTQANALIFSPRYTHMIKHLQTNPIWGWDTEEKRHYILILLWKSQIWHLEFHYHLPHSRLQPVRTLRVISLQLYKWNLNSGPRHDKICELIEAKLSLSFFSTVTSKIGLLQSMWYQGTSNHTNYSDLHCFWILHRTEEDRGIKEKSKQPMLNGDRLLWLGTVLNVKCKNKTSCN